MFFFACLQLLLTPRVKQVLKHFESDIGLT
uniref:Uncharacterized protein n=1 Tax=Arundo donax TaxID=35708 RepID=A0A0A9DRJ7_ARUDO